MQEEGPNTPRGGAANRTSDAGQAKQTKRDQQRSTDQTGPSMAPADGVGPLSQHSIDEHDPFLGLAIAAERLSIVRYVFLVQIEEGIVSAEQRASLEYADTVLIGWPERDSSGIVTLDQSSLAKVRELMVTMERRIDDFRCHEVQADIDQMNDNLVRIAELVAQVRRLYQPNFPLPTYAEIRRVVQEEWDIDIGKIGREEQEPTVEAIEKETEKADEQREELVNGQHLGPTQAQQHAHQAKDDKGHTESRA